jgi:hypothetical protein
MITEEDKEKQAIKKLEDGISLCEQALDKSEKYERLNDNTDWKGFWDDVKILIGKHDQEIRMAESYLTDAPNTTYVKMDGDSQKVVSSKADWLDFIVRHQIQKQELERWMSEPKWILEMAEQARKQIPILKEKINLMKKGENHAA